MTDPELTHNNIPPFEEVTGAYQGVLLYNRKHTGLGAAIKNHMRAGIEAASMKNTADPTDTQSDNDGELESLVEKHVAEGEMRADLNELLHGSTFERIGVRFGQSGETYRTDQAFSLSSPSLEPQIGNVELFVSFMKTLDKVVVLSSAENLRLFGGILRSLRSTVSDGYKWIPQDATAEQKAQSLERADEAVKIFDEINPELVRLGLDKPELYKRTIESGHPSYITGPEYRLWMQANDYMNDYSTLVDFQPKQGT